MEKPELNRNPVFIDNRGTFAPLQLKYNDKNQSHLIKDWIQSNVSVNPHKHTLRGLHYQIEPYAQAKLIKVISGAIIDFIVDIRPRSADYGSVHIFDLKQSDELLVPAGFAHGFITIEDNTVTLRDRDTMQQERVAIDQLNQIISKKVSLSTLLN